MFFAINFRQGNTLCGSTKMKPQILPFDEPNLCNNLSIEGFRID